MSLNCHKCISEVIDRFTQVEKEKGLRSRERKRREAEREREREESGSKDWPNTAKHKQAAGAPGP